MAQKLQSQTSTFSVEDPAGGSPSTYIQVGGVTAIGGMRSGTATEIDVSDLSSTEKEFVLGLADPGTMNLTVFYDPADQGQIILEDLRVSSARTSFQVTIPNPLNSPAVTTFTFEGFVQSFPFEVGVDQAIPGTVTVRVTGAFTKD